jgi:hypothetical protein
VTVAAMDRGYAVRTRCRLGACLPVCCGRVIADLRLRQDGEFLSLLADLPAVFSVRYVTRADKTVRDSIHHHDDCLADFETKMLTLK